MSSARMSDGTSRILNPCVSEVAELVVKESIKLPDEECSVGPGSKGSLKHGRAQCWQKRICLSLSSWNLEGPVVVYDVS